MSTLEPFEVEIEEDDKGLYKVDLEGKQPLPKQKISEQWKKYGNKVIILIGIILIAGISFEAGFLKGRKNQTSPVIVNQPKSELCLKSENSNSGTAFQSSTQNNSANQLGAENQKCAFVASKNSNKFHLATCQFAQKIKPENKVCFASKEDALSRGYIGAKCCIK